MAINNFDRLSRELQTMSDREITRRLQQEARTLKAIALKQWRRDMQDYKPKVYAVHLGMPQGKRTKQSQRGIKIGKVKRLEDGSFGIEVSWENQLMYHDSIFPNQPQGHSVMLISEGWHSRKLEQKLRRRVYRFTYFEGTNYLARVIKAYNSIKPSWVTLIDEWKGNKDYTRG